MSIMKQLWKTPAEDSLTQENAGAEAEGLTENEEEEADVAWDKFQTAIIMFIMSYADWYCYGMIMLACILYPSVFNMVLPISVLCYALLCTPSPMYWELAQAYVELIIVVKSALQVSPQTRNVAVSQTHQSDGFFADVSFEVLQLLMLHLHKYAMHRWGMWGKRGQTEIAFTHPRTWLASFKKWYGNTISAEDKIGQDLYIYTFIVQLIVFLVLFMSYYSIVGSHGSFLSSIQSNLLPGPLVLIQLLLFYHTVLDRVIYVFHSLRWKLVLHVTSVIVFFISYCMLYIVLDRPRNSMLDLLFFLQALHFSLSAYQIQVGFATVTPHRLTDTYSDPKYYTYVVFRSIPFVFELKSLIDWTFTRTSLKLWYWLKLEDVHHELMFARADVMDNAFWNRKVGDPWPKFPKFYQGFAGFMGIMFVIFLPLLYYSSFSPALAFNQINGTRVDISFSSSAPIYGSRLGQFSPVIDNAHPVNDWTPGTLVEKTRKGIASLGWGDTDSSLQVLSLSRWSMTGFSMSPPAYRSLVSVLNDTEAETVALEVTVSLLRAKGVGGPRFEVKQSWHADTYERRRGIIDLLNATRHCREGANTSSSVLMPAFYTPFLINSPLTIDVAPALGLAPTYAQHDCQLTVACENAERFAGVECTSLFQNGNGVEPDFALTPEEADCVSGDGDCPLYGTAGQTSTNAFVPIYFVCLSEMVPSGEGLGAVFESFSIVALYSAFVLALARVLRLVLTGKSYRIPVEDMEDPTPLIRLVEDIKVAREEGDLGLEEELYFELINIYQSTELMRLWTTPVTAEPLRQHHHFTH